MKSHVLFSALGATVFPLLISCAATKPTITDIPAADLESDIIFFNDNALFEPGEYARIKLNNPVIEKIFDPGLKITSLLGRTDLADSYRPSVSPRGNYLANLDRKFKIIRLEWGRKVAISIFDIRKGTFVRDLKIKIPRFEYEAETYTVPWSVLDDSFFVLEEDAILKFFPDGKKIRLLELAKIRAFSVSPSEKFILLYHGDQMSLYDTASAQMDTVKTFAKGLLPTLRFVRGMTWAPSDNRVAFGVGWRICVYDLERRKLEEYKAKGVVFDITWISNNVLVFVEGDYPSDASQLQTTKYFKLIKLNLDEGKLTTLHARSEHEPFSIKPQLSPSGQFLLFAEKDLNGPYRVKLLSLDGQRMKKIADGCYPIWGNK